MNFIYTNAVDDVVFILSNYYIGAVGQCKCKGLNASSIYKCREYIEVADVMEYVHRSTINITNLTTVHERKGRSTLYDIVRNDFGKRVTTKWKLQA